ncbi:MAG: hypothetical protein JW702_05000 [Clostridiales bacterium]|nr:hypothetical protein [Clostridiales bacterium]
MKDKELKKIYRHTQKSNAYHIDIRLEDYWDAYSSWDYSPFVNRDLDEDLLEYLMSSSYEIPRKYSIIIDLHLMKGISDERREQKSREGMYNYFKYKIRQAKNERFRMFRDTITFLLLGTVMLLLSYVARSLITNNIAQELVSEGLVIGAWVMIWEMFYIWFFQINQLSYKIKHYTRLTSSNIVFQYEN